MSDMKKLFGEKPCLIGMVHLKALPGTASFNNNMSEIYNSAVKDAKKLEAGGIGAVMVENFSDMPYSINLETEQRTALAAITREVNNNIDIPVGVDAALSDYKAALSAAKVADADFVRIAVFVDSVDSFAGIIQPCASEAIKYRKKIGGEDIKIFADVQVKYTHMLKNSIDIVESASNARACMADGVIVTGKKTGQETSIEIVEKVKNHIDIPVLIGSGVSPENISEQMSIADGAIVGSSLKVDGKAINPVDKNRVELLINNYNK